MSQMPIVKQFGPYLLWIHGEGIRRGSSVTLIDRETSPELAANALREVAAWITENAACATSREASPVSKPIGGLVPAETPDSGQSVEGEKK